MSCRIPGCTNTEFYKSNPKICKFHKKQEQKTTYDTKTAQIKKLEKENAKLKEKIAWFKITFSRQLKRYQNN